MNKLTLAMISSSIMFLLSAIAQAGSATWDLNPGSGDWNTATNLWSSGAPNVTTTNWTDGNGDWNTASNWDNGVPNSTTNAVIGGSGHTVSLSAAGSTDNLTLASGNTLTISDNTALTVFGSSISDSGSINLSSAGSGTELLISRNVMLTGRGAVVMSNNSNNFILGTASTAVLTNNSIIEGSGNIGDNFMGLVNGTSGGIIANNGAGSNTLFIDVDTKNFNNLGQLSVDPGATMVIEGSGSFLNMNTGTSTLTGGFYQVNGTLEFPAGSNGILVDAANIRLSGASAEIFNTTNSTNALANLNTIAATGIFQIDSGANFTTGGNFTNNGSLYVSSGSAFVVNLADSLTNFNSSTHTLTGGSYGVSGTLQFANANIVTIASGTSVFMSDTSAKIEDQTGAAVGLTNFATNNGIFAIASGFNFTTAGNFTNNGTLNVGAGTKFEVNLANSLTNFSGTTLTGGTYFDFGTLQFAGANIVTIASGTSVFMSDTSAKIEDQTGAAVGLTNFATNNGTFSIDGLFNFTTAGNFTNNGTLDVGGGTKFKVNGNLTNFSGTTLTGGTYNVTGTLQFNGANIVTNAANITLTGNGSKIADQSNNNGLANFATNNGTFALAVNRAFTTAGNFANAGTFTINTGSTFTLGGSGMFTQSGGTTTDNGSLSASSGGVSLNGGSLFGTGMITGALTSSSAGTITPGSSTATGILKDTGAYSQNSGTLDISINGTTAGTKYDQFNPTTATLSGTLNISRLATFVPAIGNTFKIMNFTSETGTFATVNGLPINNTEHFTIAYQGTDVLLTVVSGPFAGAGAHNRQPLSKAPPFDSSQPGNPTIGRRTRTVINIRDSGQLLSMLDDAVPGSDGRLTISHHNRMNDTGKTDRINADRMMKANRGRADIRHTRDRGLINPRPGGGGTRAF
jgi:hypothetical protein